MVWTREELILGHCKRHPFRIFTRWGATREGKIVAAEVRMLADGGAYKFTTSIVVSNAVINALGPYEIPNVKVDAYDVYTNNVPRGAFRGFGGPQAVYCAEQMVNKLAAGLGMDPVELRMRNLAKEGSLQTTGAPYPARRDDPGSHPGLCGRGGLERHPRWLGADPSSSQNGSGPAIPAPRVGPGLRA